MAKSEILVSIAKLELFGGVGSVEYCAELPR
jgi:hypothetical protein